MSSIYLAKDKSHGQFGCNTYETNTVVVLKGGSVTLKIGTITDPHEFLDIFSLSQNDPRYFVNSVLSTSQPCLEKLATTPLVQLPYTFEEYRFR